MAADDSPFALAGIWENWKHAQMGEWLRTTFCIITTTANELVAEIHDRMPGSFRPRAMTAALLTHGTSPRI